MTPQELAGLHVDAARMFRRIRKEFEIRDTPGLTHLAAAARSLDLLLKAEAGLQRDGECQKDKWGILKPSPWLEVMKAGRVGLIQHLRALRLADEVPEAEDAKKA